MKPLTLQVTLFTVVLALSLNSCRNTALDLTGGGSTLQGVYDNDYSLKIGRVAGDQDLYQFETCLTQAHLSKQGSSLSPEESCVPALQERGESITFFAVPAADKLTLSEEEQRSLLKMQREWGEYKNKQAKLRTEQTGALAIGGAAVVGSTAVIAGLSLSAQNDIKEAKNIRREIWDEKIDNYHNFYNRYLGTADKERAVEELVNTEKKLNNYHYSTTGSASSILENQGHIFSDDFINHMKSPTITEYLAKNNVQDDVLSILTNPSKYSEQISLDYIINKFIYSNSGWQKRDVTEIIDPNFLKRFFRYFRDNDLYNKYNAPTDAPADILSVIDSERRINEKYTQGKLKYLIEDINLFVKNKGAPTDILRDINKNKIILENLVESFPDSVLNNKLYKTSVRYEYKPLDLSETLRTFKRSEAFMDSARKLSRKNAKRITRAIQGSLAVLIVGAITTVALLHPQKKSVRTAKDALDKKELSLDNLGVLLEKSESSPLTSMNPYNNNQVSSIKDVLTYLSMAWDGINFENKATHYCFPSLQDKNTVTATCQPQGSS